MAAEGKGGGWLVFVDEKSRTRFARKYVYTSDPILSGAQIR